MELTTSCAVYMHIGLFHTLIPLLLCEPFPSVKGEERHNPFILTGGKMTSEDCQMCDVSPMNVSVHKSMYNKMSNACPMQQTAVKAQLNGFGGSKMKVFQHSLVAPQTATSTTHTQSTFVLPKCVKTVMKTEFFAGVKNSKAG